MKCQQKNGCGWLLLLLLSARIVSAQESNAPEQDLNLPLSGQSMTATENPLMNTWTNFDLAWSSLKEELIASDADSVRLSTLLAGLLIEADGLRYLLEQSTVQLESSEAARIIERDASIRILADALNRLAKAEKMLKLYKIAAIVLGGVIITETVILLVK